LGCAGAVSLASLITGAVQANAPRDDTARPAGSASKPIPVGKEITPLQEVGKARKGLPPFSSSLDSFRLPRLVNLFPRGPRGGPHRVSRFSQETGGNGLTVIRPSERTCPGDWSDSTGVGPTVWSSAWIVLGEAAMAIHFIKGGASRAVPMF